MYAATARTTMIITAIATYTRVKSPPIGVAVGAGVRVAVGSTLAVATGVDVTSAVGAGVGVASIGASSHCERVPRCESTVVCNCRSSLTFIEEPAHPQDPVSLSFKAKLYNPRLSVVIGVPNR